MRVMRLILFRHAKSDWGQPGTADIDRPLAERGRAAAPRMAAWLAAEGHAPDRVLVSNARRTRETFALMSRALGGAPEVAFEARLYDAKPHAILDIVREQPGGKTLMVVGHNPGIERLAGELAGDDPLAEAFARKYPTAAAAVFDCDVASWRELAPGRARLVAYATPKSIGAADSDDP
jgi:phosphohistidine phosphatase